jgi:hypothetical protein
MGQRGRHHNNHQKPRAGGPQSTAFRAPVVAPEKKIPITYGKPFVVLEDSQKDTFVFNGGQWIRHTKTIAECRQDCQVKELSQKINGMTRYEICTPVAQPA